MRNIDDLDKRMAELVEHDMKLNREYGMDNVDEIIEKHYMDFDIYDDFGMSLLSYMVSVKYYLKIELDFCNKNPEEIVEETCEDVDRELMYN